MNSYVAVVRKIAINLFLLLLSVETFMQLIQHQAIYFSDLSISYGQKQCIDDFNATIYYGSRIGIIGRNGSGKTSLIKILAGIIEPNDGKIIAPDDINVGYVPQLIDDGDILSGGQRFNKRLSEALSLEPNVLLLDEPTNHLDVKNRKALISMLKRYSGTLIIVTHDRELLRNVIDTIWHVANGSVTIFNGRYENYLELQKHKEQSLESRIRDLNYQKTQAHETLMKEQHRAKNSKVRGEKHIKERKWPTIGSAAKMSRSVTTAVDNKARILHNKQGVVEELQSLYVHEVLIPKFNLDAVVLGDKTIVNISDGSCGYNGLLIVSNINISLNSMEKMIIRGDNASGKSTLLKAILGDIIISKSGEWCFPNIQDIGYLEQHYSQLDANKTVVEIIYAVMPTWSHAEIRDHLNSFLLRKNEEVNLPTQYLSGGEKVRLSLALIAARPPKLLLLDEITNNIDLETKAHLIQVLRSYPGAFILICHDNDFIHQLAIDKYYQINNGTFSIESR